MTTRDEVIRRLDASYENYLSAIQGLDGPSSRRSG